MFSICLKASLDSWILATAPGCSLFMTAHSSSPDLSAACSEPLGTGTPATLASHWTRSRCRPAPRQST